MDKLIAAGDMLARMGWTLPKLVLAAAGGLMALVVLWAVVETLIELVVGKGPRRVK